MVLLVLKEVVLKQSEQIVNEQEGFLRPVTGEGVKDFKIIGRRLFLFYKIDPYRGHIVVFENNVFISTE